MNSPLLQKSGINILLFFLFSSLALFGQQAKQSVAADSTLYFKFRDYTNKYFENRKLPALSVGVARNGITLFNEIRGLSDLENPTPATKQSLFRIASISKLITAVVTVKLAERGVLNLDEDISKYIPDIPKKKWPITLRNILNHTSGLRNYREGEFNSTRLFATTKDLIDYLKKDSLEYQPRTKYLYSTLAYNFVTAVIEEVTKKPFFDVVKENILIPAGMKNTFPDIQSQIIPLRVKGYIRNDKRRIANAQLADLSIKISGGGFISNVEDLLNFGSALISGKLISPAYLDTLTAPLRLRDGTMPGYGLGISLNSDSKARKTISHSGGGTGFVSLLYMIPADSLVTVHLINLVDRNQGSPAKDLAAIALGDSITPPLKSLADTLAVVYDFEGIPGCLKTYSALKKTPANAFNLNPDELKQFAYDLIGWKKILDAVSIFNEMLKEDPLNKSAYIGLGDAYSEDKNVGLALKNYRHAAKLDPSNKYVQQRITFLEKIK